MDYAERTQRATDNGLGDLLAAPTKNQISFAGGLPDPQLFPQQELSLAFATALANHSGDQFQYSDAQGFRPLRVQLAQLLQRDGVRATADTIAMTQGAQQALDLIARLYINPGDTIVVEAPTYPGAISAFDTYEPHYAGVPVQSDGMDMVALRRILTARHVKLIYTVPDFQNPTGTVMSLAKRRTLLALAREFDVMIIEDAPYRWLRYDGTNLPTLSELDDGQHVIFVDSMSKILAPGLRVGWVHANQAVINDLVALKSGADLESSTLTLRGVSQYLHDNDITAHITALRHSYRHKRDVMLQGLRANLPAAAQLSSPQGGFFIWVTLPTAVDTDALARQCKATLALVPGSMTYPLHDHHNGIRLAFTHCSPAEITAGCARLGHAVQTALAAATTLQAR
ncbi:PLP-dependent aminotransferase family protein [Lacticaseibacillus thailandensis]|uniref:Aminotransferase n=1 Tax=Lacticaseibacillus thailandensis DSM 22698 = JCM 13996 TaxID=1423810 RepID=A0A0R2C5G3_9LACO|nr:PLP-dependent aminotransferase family protein [Lacticaseibacillus thailandensis]KRM86570.1 aminotransferase [Lacticaseibacillus thailandensis DSM 22698 = JCM 13996]